MHITPRAVIVAAFGVGPLLLAAGCGGTSATGARATLANIQPTSFVEIAPATTTTTTTLAPDFTPEAGTRSPAEQVYTIQPNDGLAKIAALYDITLEQLINYNQFADGINTLILPGQQIKIPPDALVPGTATETATPGDQGGTGDTAADATSPPGEGCTHVIAAGEFPNKVARQYEITYEELQAANPAMDMTTTFVVGDTVIIPANGKCG
jgi:LysM repeat protein